MRAKGFVSAKTARLMDVKLVMPPPNPDED
ncbi:hypothetical protein X743_33650 [Mesorhizobium sp. LNHC252B00]|nr:hypothetical protein X743_33650 [Mesorhizobium sp. LNHC252B00]